MIPLVQNVDQAQYSYLNWPKSAMKLLNNEDLLLFCKGGIPSLFLHGCYYYYCCTTYCATCDLTNFLDNIFKTEKHTSNVHVSRVYKWIDIKKIDIFSRNHKWLL